MSYDLDDYQDDLDEADQLYLKVVKAECLCPVTNTVKLLSEGEISTVKRRALAVKAQHIGVAGKRLRQAVAVDMLDRMKAEGMDITPTLAVAIAKHLLGRGVDRKMLLHRYATQGRTAANKADFEVLEGIEQQEAFKAAQNALQRVLEKASNMRAAMKKDYSDSPAARLLSEAAGG